MRVFLLIFLTILMSTAYAQHRTLFPPTAELLRLDSTTVNANDIVQPGQLTMIVYWNSMMRPAFNELDSLHEVYAEWQKKYGVEIIAVAWEYPKNPQNLGKLLAKRNWRYPIYRDPVTKFGGSSGAHSLPKTYFFDKQGNLVHETTGFDAAEMVKYEEKLRELSNM